jgi:hypothetical protein
MVDVSIAIVLGDNLNYCESILPSVEARIPHSRGFVIACKSDKSKIIEEFIDDILSFFDTNSELFDYTIFTMTTDCKKKNSYTDIFADKAKTKKYNNTLVFCNESPIKENQEVNLAFSVDVLG